MHAAQHPNRSRLFRFITIAASGLGSFVLGLWGLKLGFGDGLGGMSAQVIASLCALAAAAHEASALSRGV